MEDETTRTFLMEPLSISDLVATGTTFEINTNFDEPDETYLDELNLESDNENENAEDELEGFMSPWTQPFEELKLQMEPLNDQMYKRVIRASKTGGERVSTNARVCIRYNAYWEGETVPFDSSYLRGSQFSFYTGRGEVLTGLEYAVCSMQAGEEAQFVISYELLFGKMGCPPRVKPKADGLFIIFVVSFNEIGDIDAEQQVAPEDRNKYGIIIEKVKQIHLKGLDFFKLNHYRNAARAFEKAVDCLNFCHLANEEEQEEQSAFLIKLNTNLAVCYNKTNQPGKTCIVMKEIRRLTNNKPSCKALFQEGRAMLLLGEYKRAYTLLRRALQMEPANEEINKELKHLDAVQAKYEDASKTIWMKAMGLVKDKENQKPKENQDTKQFEDGISELIKSFQENANMQEVHLPSGLTSQEVDVVEQLAKRLDLKLNVVHGDETNYCLRKNTKEVI